MQERELLEFGPFRLIVAERILEREGTAIPLTPKVFDLLVYLAQNPSRLITRDELVQHLWPDSFVDESNLTVNVSMLRKALGDGLIQTVPKQGYRFLTEVRRVAGSPSPAPVGAAGAVAAAERMEQARVTSKVAAPVAGAAVTEVKGRGAWRFASIVSAVALLSGAVAGVAWWIATERKAPVARPYIKVTPLTTDPGAEYDPTLSPEGTRVAYASFDFPKDRWRVLVKQIPNGEPVQLSEEEEDANKPAWSPDGTLIAYVATRGLTRTLMLAPATGSGPKRKLGESQRPRSPNPVGPVLSWTPDNRWLVFSEGVPESGPSYLCAISVESGEKRQVTFPEGRIVGDAHPAISPDGRLLLFSRNVTNAVGDYFAVSISAPEMKAAGQPKQLTFTQGMTGGASWTPDGSAIVFTTGAFSSTSLMRLPVRSDLSRQEPEGVNFAGDDGLSPSVAPGLGKNHGRLAFQRLIDDVNLWRMPLTAGNGPAGPHQPWAASTRMESTPAISPDGSRVAFASTRSGSWEIWICQESGTHCSQVTNFGKSFTRCPRWSADGKLLVFDSRVAGSSDIYVIRADGGGLRRVTTEAGNEFAPNWSQDGKSLYFSSNRTGNYEIWRVDANGEGAAVQVTTGGGDFGFESDDGRWFYYTSFAARSIRRVALQAPAAGAPYEELASGVLTGLAFRLVGTDLYFVRDFRRLEHMDVRTGKVTTLLRLENFDSNGLAVSPDQRWLLFARRDRLTSDLYLVDGFW